MECVLFRIQQEGGGIQSPMMRYDLLGRAAKVAQRCGLSILAFGVNARQVRFVMEGDMLQMPNFIRGVKVGTLRSARARGIELGWGTCRRITVCEEELSEGVEWAHRAALDSKMLLPLQSLWSSHRDLMGYRKASFYNPEVLHGRVDPSVIHRNLGGIDVPEREKRHQGRKTLNELLRISGAVIGVLPADRKCFRLFAHLAKQNGWRNMDIALALSLTSRRIRQLLSQAEPNLQLAHVSLSDPRLVPMV